MIPAQQRIFDILLVNDNQKKISVDIHTIVINGTVLIKSCSYIGYNRTVTIYRSTEYLNNCILVHNFQKGIHRPSFINLLKSLLIMEIYI